MKPCAHLLCGICRSVRHQVSSDTGCVRVRICMLEKLQHAMQVAKIKSYATLLVPNIVHLTLLCTVHPDCFCKGGCGISCGILLC